MSSNSGYSEDDFNAMLLNARLLEVFCYAIHTCVFCVAMYHIAVHPSRNRQRMILAGLVTYLWCSVTVILALDWQALNITLFPRILSPLEENFERYGYTVIIALSRTNIILADVLLIWRCWTLYGRNWIVTGCLGLWLLVEIGLIFFLSFVFDIWDLVWYAMTAFTNTLCTSLILYRIIRVSGVHASLKTYRGIIEILVESAVLYSGIFIALVVTSVLVVGPGFWGYYPLTLSYGLTGIAPTLIVVRVMAGHSRPDDSWTRTSLPPLGSNARNIEQSMRFASVAHRHSTTHTATNIDLEAARETTGFERDATRATVTV